MILQFVSADNLLAKGLKDLLRSLGISLVHYTDPIKAMDNLRETGPKIILYSLQDFPRHWKIMMRFLKEDLGKSQVIFILFSREKPDVEEADKAVFLGVNALIQYQGNAESLARQVKDIYARYGAFENDGEPVYLWETGDTPLGFLFRHPIQQFLIPGRLTRLEKLHGVFKPENRLDILQLEAGQTLTNCSLFIENQSVFLDCLILSNTGQLLLEFQNPCEKTCEAIGSKLRGLALT
ncbi:MAG: hypothetical protein A2Z96_07505 [Spirochaetes bacterium GWB1_48_6]|nr:MAG: hypothetical protein A2Z96_07505 [Spirochaetes bacterium GWB1_48_6]